MHSFPSRNSVSRNCSLAKLKTSKIRNRTIKCSLSTHVSYMLRSGTRYFKVKVQLTRSVNFCYRTLILMSRKLLHFLSRMIVQVNRMDSSLAMTCLAL